MTHQNCEPSPILTESDGVNSVYGASVYFRWERISPFTCELHNFELKNRGMQNNLSFNKSFFLFFVLSPSHPFPRCPLSNWHFLPFATIVIYLPPGGLFSTNTKRNGENESQERTANLSKQCELCENFEGNFRESICDNSFCLLARWMCTFFFAATSHQTENDGTEIEVGLCNMLYAKFIYVFCIWWRK